MREKAIFTERISWQDFFFVCFEMQTIADKEYDNDVYSCFLFTECVLCAVFAVEKSCTIKNLYAKYIFFFFFGNLLLTEVFSN